MREGPRMPLRAKDPEVMEFEPKNPFPITCQGPIELPPARSY